MKNETQRTKEEENSQSMHSFPGASHEFDSDSESSEEFWLPPNFVIFYFHE